MGWHANLAGLHYTFNDQGNLGDSPNNTLDSGFIEWRPAEGVGNKLVYVGDLGLQGGDSFQISFRFYSNPNDDYPEFKIYGYGNFDSSFQTTAYFEVTTNQTNTTFSSDPINDETQGNLTGVCYGEDIGLEDYITATYICTLEDADQATETNFYLSNRIVIECLTNPDQNYIVLDGFEVKKVLGTNLDNWTTNSIVQWNNWNTGGNPGSGSIRLGNTGNYGTWDTTQELSTDIPIGAEATLEFNLNANAAASGDTFEVHYHNEDGYGFKLNPLDFGGTNIVGGFQSFTRTVGDSTTSDPNNYGKLTFIYDQNAGQRVKLDNVSLSATYEETDDWSFPGGNNPTGTLELADGVLEQDVLTTLDPGNYHVEVDVLGGFFPLHINVGFKNEPISMLTDGINNMLPGTYTADIELTTASAPIFQLTNNTGVTNGSSSGSQATTVKIASISVKEIIPYGGTVTDWNLQGDEGEIFYNEINTENFITFNGAAAETTLSQNVNGSDFKLDDKYRITFKISNYIEGTLKAGLFNDNAQGFELTGISGNGQHSFTGTIGDVSNTIPSLNSSFFIQAEDLGFTGDIDDITLEQIGGGKTISFSEKAKGWVSFKSFVPEYGISVSNQYYTMSLGTLWKHHVTKDIYGSSVNRNTFYGDFKNSSVTPILNMQPEIVKNFNTLNYEGSNSAITQFTTDPVSGLTDGEYYNLQPRKGWYITEINTNKQVGTLNEFIEKEGKWFNYIKGTPGKIDPSAFNFQGLGLVQEIIETVEE